MTNKISKLEATLGQWKEILDKETGVSADLRNQEKASQAFQMILKLEGKIKELEVYG